MGARRKFVRKKPGPYWQILDCDVPDFQFLLEKY
jgi:hypothetical protein